MPLPTYAAIAACVASGRTTRSPSGPDTTWGSCVSASRLKGANFSRAMRSQVSSTASKVSRECSAKRGRSSRPPMRSQ